MKTAPERRWLVLAVVGVMAVLTVGTLRNPNFWRTADQRGDALSRKGEFAAAAKVYGDPWRIGAAQYHDGDFAAAAKTFARVPGPIGAFDAGNAWLMAGKYELAIAAYDRALKTHAGWREAEENRALAVARRDQLAAAGQDSDAEPPEEKPDQVVFDEKGKNAKAKHDDMAGGVALSDAALQATWLRRVQTNPGDFLKAKFAYEAQQAKGTP